MIASKMIRGLASFSLLACLAGAGGCTSEPADGEGSIDDTEAAAAVSQALGGCGHDLDPLIPHGTPQGQKTYDKHAEGWLKWAMKLPWSTGPINDPTGEQCDLGQSGSVWYLAGTSGGPVTRSCDIPKNKALYFPLINQWMIPPAERVDAPEEMAEFIAFAEHYFPAKRDATCSLTLRLDGEDLRADTAELDEELWLAIYEPFKVKVNADNYAGRPGGKLPAALIAGHYAMLRPLAPGDHTLEFGGVQCEDGEVVFETSAVYYLHVEH
jgi:hypothetical protein